MNRGVYQRLQFFAFIFAVLLISVAIAHAQSGSNEKKSPLPCIQEGFSPDDIVKIGSDGSSKVTVGKRLVELRARCRKGKLIAGNGREIRFYRAACWGNPPADYLDILEQQRKELAALKKKYTVIEIACDPRSIAGNFSHT